MFNSNKEGYLDKRIVMDILDLAEDSAKIALDETLKFASNTKEEGVSKAIEYESASHFVIRIDEIRKLRERILDRATLD